MLLKDLTPPIAKGIDPKDAGVNIIGNYIPGEQLCGKIWFFAEFVLKGNRCLILSLVGWMLIFLLDLPLKDFRSEIFRFRGRSDFA